MNRSNLPLLFCIGTIGILMSGFVTPAITHYAAPTATPPASTKTSETDGMVMQFVPAGDFTMGYSLSKKDMAPGHTVTLDAFWMDRTEVTNAQYAKCVSAGACDAPQDLTSHNRVKYYNGEQYASFPVLNISWNEANAYCHWAGRALPTEAQWEKAARGTDARLYPWGDKVPSKALANYGNLQGDTTLTGSYPDGASPYGVLDMAGNVREWTADWYDETYYKTSPQYNPTGPVAGYKRTARGSSWGDDRSAHYRLS